MQKPGTGDSFTAKKYLCPELDLNVGNGQTQLLAGGKGIVTTAKAKD